MKRAFIAASIAAAVALAPVAALAVPDEYDDTQSHPLRVASYLLYPVGYAAEMLIFRPFHFVVANAGPVFGHRPHGESHIE